MHGMRDLLIGITLLSLPVGRLSNVHSCILCFTVTELPPTTMTITTDGDTTFESSSQSTDAPEVSTSEATTMDTEGTPIETSTPTDQRTTTVEQTHPDTSSPTDPIDTTGETTTQAAGTLTFSVCVCVCVLCG